MNAIENGRLKKRQKNNPQMTSNTIKTYKKKSKRSKNSYIRKVKEELKNIETAKSKHDAQEAEQLEKTLLQRAFNAVTIKEEVSSSFPSFLLSLSLTALAVR